ncbi:MAG TPA: hypothetical protein VF632_01550 [Longimicrobium sp.]
MDRYLSSADLEPVPVTNADVLAFWTKVERALDDAHEAGISLDTRLLCACGAALLVAVAIGRAAGYHFCIGDDQQQIVFDVARSLVRDSKLANALSEMTHFLPLWHAVENEPFKSANVHDVSAAITAATLVINLGAKHLGVKRPISTRPAI